MDKIEKIIILKYDNFAKRWLYFTDSFSKFNEIQKLYDQIDIILENEDTANYEKFEYSTLVDLLLKIKDERYFDYVLLKHDYPFDKLSSISWLFLDMNEFGKENFTMI